MSDLALPIMAGRCLRLSRRQPDVLMTALALPVLLMVLFVELFGGAIDTGGPKYVTYVVPGVLVLCAGFGAALTAVSVCQDLQGGIVDRFRSLDVGGVAVLGGHVAASVVRNAVSFVLVVGVAVALGFRPEAAPLHWLGAAGVLLAFVLALSWLAAVIGMVARSPETANGATFVVAFLPYASSAFVPVSTMPHWIQGFAAHQPITPVVETLRALLVGGASGSSPIEALAWSAGILAVAMVLSAVLFQRRVTSR